MSYDPKSENMAAQKVIIVQPPVVEEHDEFHLLTLNLAEWASIFGILLAIAGMAKIAHNWSKKRKKAR